MGNMTNRQSFYVGIKGLIKNQAGEILILNDTSKGKWEVPGGRIDAGAGIEDSFAREISEEIPGATHPKLGELIYASVGDFIVENDHRLLLLFYAAQVTLPEKIALSDEHSAVAWAGKASLQKFDIFASDRLAIEMALMK